MPDWMLLGGQKHEKQLYSTAAPPQIQMGRHKNVDQQVTWCPSHLDSHVVSEPSDSHGHIMPKVENEGKGGVP